MQRCQPIISTKLDPQRRIFSMEKKNGNLMAIFKIGHVIITMDRISEEKDFNHFSSHICYVHVKKEERILRMALIESEINYFLVR